MFGVDVKAINSEVVVVNSPTKNKRIMLRSFGVFMPIVMVPPFTVSTADRDRLNILFKNDRIYLILSSKEKEGITDVSSLNINSDLYKVASKIGSGSDASNFAIVLKSSGSSALFSKIPISKNEGYSKLEKAYAGVHCDKLFSNADLSKALNASYGQIDFDLKNTVNLIQKLNSLGYSPDIVSLEFYNRELKCVYMVE